jgi:hypothetical protein
VYESYDAAVRNNGGARRQRVVGPRGTTPYDTAVPKQRGEGARRECCRLNDNLGEHVAGQEQRRCARTGCCRVTFVYLIDDRDFGNNGCALARSVIGLNGLETFPDLFRNNGCPGDGSLTHNR